MGEHKSYLRYLDHCHHFYLIIFLLHQLKQKETMKRIVWNKSFHALSGGFCPRGILSRGILSGGFCPGDFVRGVLSGGDFVLEPFAELQYGNDGQNKHYNVNAKCAADTYSKFLL